MHSNDKIIMKQILETYRIEQAPHLNNSEYFELFVAEQMLKNFDLTNEDVESGLTGGGSDGGIDAIYAFVNGRLIAEDADVSEYRRGANIDLIIIQSKISEGFSSTAIDKFKYTTNNILDLSKDLSDLRSEYNFKLIQIFQNFRKVFTGLLSKFPTLSIKYVYASLGDTEQIHQNIYKRIDDLQSHVKSFLPDINFSFSFLGAGELLELARKAPSTSFQINLIENAISTRKQGYLCLVNLREYFTFITDSDGELRKYIFDSNVRDYLGTKVDVNKGIRESLTRQDSEDFWWLNNGITILASKGTIVAKTITLEDVKIVNGLQTSTEIYDYFSSTNKQVDDRSILVKIIVTYDLESQDKIIRATNSQTSIPLASLKATDKIQRDIEDYFKKHDLYYDRRKNFYKNLGLSRDKVISIPYLAQVVISIVFKEPNEARARPSSILKKDQDYKNIFNSSNDLDIYLNCVKIAKKVESFMRSDQVNLSSDEKNNLKFHIAMSVAVETIQRVNYKPSHIAKIELAKVDDNLLASCTKTVVDLFHRFIELQNTNPDTTGKSREFVTSIIELYSEKFGK